MHKISIIKNAIFLGYVRNFFFFNVLIYCLLLSYICSVIMYKKNYFKLNYVYDYSNKYYMTATSPNAAVFICSRIYAFFLFTTYRT